MKTYVCLLLLLTAVFAPIHALAAIDNEQPSILTCDGLYFRIISEEDHTIEVARRMSWSDETGWEIDSQNHYCFESDVIILPKYLINGIRYSVIGIGEQAFDSATFSKKLSLPATITYIRSLAFSNCSCETINVPAGCTDISDNAFVHFKSKEFDLETGNKYYKLLDGILYRTDSDGKPTDLMRIIANYGSDVTPFDVEVPAGVERICDRAFAGARIRSIKIPNSVTSIGVSAFHLCSSLSEITIPKSATSIGERAFAFCSSLSRITIPESITCIGSNVFDGCSSLREIMIPESVTSIGRGAFHSCRSLNEITIPESVTSIGDYAVSDCYKLSSIKIPSAVEYLNKCVFSWCSNLKTVELPMRLKNISIDAFDGCDQLRKIYCPMQTPVPCDIEWTENQLKYGTLYVPNGCMEAYDKVEPWKNFWNIEEYASTVSVDEAASDEMKSVIGIYDLNGRAVREDMPGIRIVRYSDGSVKKAVN